MSEYKSERKIDEEVKEYTRQRFEEYMQMADMGILTRELAISALRDELEYKLGEEQNEQSTQD